MTKFLDWHAGASAVIEIFGSSIRRKRVYQFKYTPPFHATIRPSVENNPLTDLDRINQRLNEFVMALEPRAANGEPRPKDGAQSAALDKIQTLGQQLLYVIIPGPVQFDLQGEEGLFVEIGMDEALLQYPWELMHDGQDFLCLKQAVGRFVNGSPEISIAHTAKAPGLRLGSSMDKLKVLLISVPNPQPQPDIHMECKPLPGAEAETNAICDVLAVHDDIELELLRGRDATYDNVYHALREPHHIIHYNGHASFNEKMPQESGLVLYDDMMRTSAIKGFISPRPPILCFINACETTRTASWKGRYNIYDLARAFLETGTYLLGSRWEISDTAARQFAPKFYECFLVQGKSLGRSTREARRYCKDNSSLDDLAWASYVLYGDPRICFSERVLN